MSQASILIVEDEPIVAADLAAKVEKLGYPVAGIADNGQAAIEMATHLSPHLVLMDIVLRDAMDGIETAQRIRMQCDLPVIYLTAHSDTATLSRAKITGPSGYILKPFDERELAIQIELALFKHHSERQLRESHQELAEYANILTHYLKAPFRAIQNYTEFLTEDLAGSVGQDAQALLTGLMTAVSQANSQFKDLDELYRVSKTAIDAESFDLADLLDELELRYNDDGHQRLVISDQHWPTLRCGRFFLRLMLIELIDNGLKFNRSPDKRVDLSWQHLPGRPSTLAVRDNGIGFEPRYASELFQVFRRLHTDQEFDGTGIGLAIVRRVVKKLGGSIQVESGKGEGSTFSISLPLALQDDSSS